MILLSPAKSLNYNSVINCEKYSQPIFQDKIFYLVDILRQLKIDDLRDLFKISQKLAELNYERYQNYDRFFNQKNSRQALLAFNGDVYNNIEVNEFNDKNFEYAQDNILILSGLYGLLRPLDLMQPYRLEMGTELAKNDILKNHQLSNLYNFWRQDIANYLNQKTDFIINLASNEYFGAVDCNLLQGKRIINIIFKDNKNGQLKIIGINSKKARGAMANFAIKNNITNPNDLKDFNGNGYAFDANLSDENNWIYTK